MKTIKLTQNKYALVDNKDFKYLNQFRWHAHKDRTNYYAIRYISKNKRSRMHREIVGSIEKGKEVDHADGNGLNNQRKNLRVCSHLENMRNTKLSSRNTSGIKGVSWYQANNKWRADASMDGKLIYLGSFKNIKDANNAYKKFTKKNYKQFVRMK